MRCASAISGRMSARLPNAEPFAHSAIGNPVKPFIPFQTDALALASPSGRISKRALKSAQDRIAQQLFGDLGPGGLKGEGPPQPTERERLLSQAARLRELAALGMSVRKFTKEATRLEALARQ